MSKLPEFVYLITVDSEWPVSALAGDSTDGAMAERIEHVVERRCRSENVPHRSYVHVWRVPVKDAVEMELLPRAEVKPSLRAKE